MNILQFAALVDRILAPAFVRSQLSRVQKDVQDKMIADHHEAGSTPAEAADIIRSCLSTLARV